MRLTSKGQVTVPLAVRERLALLPGTEVVFEVVGDHARIRKAPGGQRRGLDLIRRLRGRATSGMSTGQILKLTREE